MNQEEVETKKTLKMKLNQFREWLDKRELEILYLIDLVVSLSLISLFVLGRWEVGLGLFLALFYLNFRMVDINIRMLVKTSLQTAQMLDFLTHAKIAEGEKGGWIVKQKQPKENEKV